MEVLNKPNLMHQALGKTFKILRMETGHGMKMPPQHSTQKAVNIVHKRKALLQMTDNGHFLKKRIVLSISQRRNQINHKREINAIAVMAAESKFNFI